jgi:hypothetical protein
MSEVYGRASSDHLIVKPSPLERALLRKEADKEGSSSASTTVITSYMFRDAMLKLLLAETLPYAKLVAD